VKEERHIGHSIYRMNNLEKDIIKFSSFQEFEKQFEKLLMGEVLHLFNLEIKYSNEPKKFMDQLLDLEGFGQVSRYRILRSYAKEAIELGRHIIIISCHNSRYTTEKYDYAAAFIIYADGTIYLTAATEFELKLGLLLRWMFHYHMKTLQIDRITTTPSVKKLLRYYQTLGYSKVNGEHEEGPSEEEKRYPPRFSVRNTDKMEFYTSKSYVNFAQHCFDKLKDNFKVVENINFSL